MNDDIASEFQEINNIVCVSVMAHEIPAYPLLVRTIMRQEDVVDVLSVSIFDVRMMSTYLSNAFDFIYYLYVRSQLGDSLIYETEGALLGYHLKARLVLPDNVDGVMIDEAYSQELDADYPERAANGKSGLSMKFGLRAIDEIVDQIVSSDEPTLFRTFSIMRGMSGEAAKAANRMLIKLDAKMSADRDCHDGTVGFGATTITFILARSRAAAVHRFELLKLKRAAERRYTEEHFLFLSSNARRPSRKAKMVETSRRPRFQIRGLAVRRGDGAQEGATAFPVRIPASEWDIASAR